MVREYGILCWFIKWNEATKKLTDCVWVSSGRIVTCLQHGLIKNGEVSKMKKVMLGDNGLDTLVESSIHDL